MTVAKIVTHSGQIVNVFIVNKNPVLFEDRGGTIYPTVTLLWEYPGESSINMLRGYGKSRCANTKAC